MLGWSTDCSWCVQRGSALWDLQLSFHFLFTHVLKSFLSHSWTETWKWFQVKTAAQNWDQQQHPCPPQIGVSHQLSSVSSYVVDLKRVKKSGGSVIQGIIQDNQPLAEPKDPKGSALRRNYERPMTTCHSQRYDTPINIKSKRISCSLY